MSQFIEQIRTNFKSDVFSHAALASILTGSPDKRYGLVKRALAAEHLIALRKGLYCLSERYRRHPLDLFEMAQHIYGPSYISFESALSYHGWIPEAVYTVTSASYGKSKDFKTSLGDFHYARIPARVFFDGVERIAAGYFVARPVRALLDYVYVSKVDWAGIDVFMKSLRIEREVVKEISGTELKHFYKLYPNTKVRKFIDSLSKDLMHEC